VKNPDGSDYMRHEPRLVDSEKGPSNMLQWVQFLDHLLFIGYDIAAVKGKATGGHSRTIYPVGSATRLAKNRSLYPDPLVYQLGDTAIWDLLAKRITPEQVAAGQTVQEAVASNDLPPE
jgi:hypothetical protein